MEASSDGEDDAENADKVTETVMNGSMKETLSLTVDAKTETAVFKSEEGKLSTSQDASCKYVVEENAEVAEEAPSTLQPASSSPEQRTDQRTLLGETSVNGPV
nr:serine/threonine-protein phosphatase 6 regulatory subunit 3-like isoform X2 [Dromaius novaehollandiae]